MGSTAHSLRIKYHSPMSTDRYHDIDTYHVNIINNTLYTRIPHHWGQRFRGTPPEGQRAHHAKHPLASKPGPGRCATTWVIQGTVGMQRLHQCMTHFILGSQKNISNIRAGNRIDAREHETQDAIQTDLLVRRNLTCAHAGASHTSRPPFPLTQHCSDNDFAIYVRSSTLLARKYKWPRTGSLIPALTVAHYLAECSALSVRTNLTARATASRTLGWEWQ